jgi:hypothetical protein
MINITSLGRPVTRGFESFAAILGECLRLRPVSAGQAFSLPKVSHGTHSGRSGSIMLTIARPTFVDPFVTFGVKTMLAFRVHSVGQTAIL